LAGGNGTRSLVAWAVEHVAIGRAMPVKRVENFVFAPAEVVST
jgi:hypothetical protein